MTNNEEVIKLRMKQVKVTAAENYRRIADAGFNVDQVSRSAMAIGQGNMSARTKLGKLVTLVNGVAATAAPFVACKASCSGCCHIPLPISEVEAEQIGLAIGRTPEKMQSNHEGSMEKFTGVACTFLLKALVQITSEPAQSGIFTEWVHAAKTAAQISDGVCP